MNKPQIGVRSSKTYVSVRLTLLQISPVWWEGNPCNNHLVRIQSLQKALRGSILTFSQARTRQDDQGRLHRRRPHGSHVQYHWSQVRRRTVIEYSVPHTPLASSDAITMGTDGTVISLSAVVSTHGGVSFRHEILVRTHFPVLSAVSPLPRLPSRDIIADSIEAVWLHLLTDN